METTSTRPWFKHLLPQIEACQREIFELGTLLSQSGQHPRDPYIQLNRKIREVKELYRQLHEVSAIQNVLEADETRIDLILSELLHSEKLLGTPPPETP